jgi:hypothetical protein
MVAIISTTFCDNATYLIQRNRPEFVMLYEHVGRLDVAERNNL